VDIPRQLENAPTVCRGKRKHPKKKEECVFSEGGQVDGLLRGSCTAFRKRTKEGKVNYKNGGVQKRPRFKLNN